MKKLFTTAVAVGMFASMMPVSADVAATALPQLNNANNAVVTTKNADMNIQIQGGQGGVGTLNWNSYNIGKDASVNYEFSAHNQTALNKVAASGGLSQIYGKITNSGCQGCGYAGTGKVILLNPNGVLFGDGANVNLNSFTVSNMDGTYNKDNNRLELTKGANQKDFGINVQEGAKIYGDKNVTFAADNINVYSGSKISTNTAANFNDTAYGKVKLVTADGVNFTYYNNGAVRQISDAKASNNKMVLQVNGDITSGHIDMRNYSNDASTDEAALNIKGANLKAVKAVKGNDGNIWLMSNNKVVSEGSTLQTVNADGAANVKGGNVKITAADKASVATSNIDAVGDVTIASTNKDALIDNSQVSSLKDVALTAGNKASIQNNSVVNAQNVTVDGKVRGQIVSSKVTANKDINVVSPGTMAWTEKATLKAGNDINITGSNGKVLTTNSNYEAKNNVNLTAKETISSSQMSGSTFKTGKDINLTSTGDSVVLNSYKPFQPTGKLNIVAAKNGEITAPSGNLPVERTTFKVGENVVLTAPEGNVNVKDTAEFIAAKKVYIQGKNNVTTSGTVDMNNIQTNITAGNDVNVTLKNVGNRQNGLVATAGRNMTVTTPGTLSVSSLISGNDMTINANKVIAGLPYTKNQKLPDDLVSERSYIEVGGEFTSNVPTDNYEITASGDPTNDGKYNQRHHIQYTPEEKILLVNKRPRNDGATDPNVPNNGNGDEKDVIEPGQVPSTDPTTPIVPVIPTPDPQPQQPDPQPVDEGCVDNSHPFDDNYVEEEVPGLVSNAVSDRK